jgi:hypothetical protein
MPGEADALNAYLQERKNQGLRVNISYIGVEVIGEQEAWFRLGMYLKALENPDRKWSCMHRLPPGTSSLTPSDI